jgi:hypothetical protein
MNSILGDSSSNDGRFRAQVNEFEFLRAIKLICGSFVMREMASAVVTFHETVTLRWQLKLLGTEQAARSFILLIGHHPGQRPVKVQKEKQVIGHKVVCQRDVTLAERFSCCWAKIFFQTNCHFPVDGSDLQLTPQ